ncbi:hypothetical protein LWI29_004761 [Acer saccharum]|uniref:ATP-dependent DNA helicase n=1 Tax=Acer saccharum TaxID=4024 RepID=A0AA39SRA7_ACESA|nr:hypothetical protein LWI29_004761 [Acer saccharum]
MEKTFGGKTVLLGGDFWQTLPVVPKGSREDVGGASINMSPIWDHCHVFVLKQNMRIKDSSSFREWVLAIIDGKLPTSRLEEEEESSWIKIPYDLLIPPGENPIQNIVASTYPNLLTKYID